MISNFSWAVFLIVYFFSGDRHVIKVLGFSSVSSCQATDGLEQPPSPCPRPRPQRLPTQLQLLAVERGVSVYLLGMTRSILYMEMWQRTSRRIPQACGY